MNYAKLLSAVAAASITAGGAKAQSGYEGALALQYNKFLSDSEDADGTAIDFENRVTIDAFLLEMDIARSKLKDGNNDTMLNTDREAIVSYRHQNGVRLGVYNAIDGHKTGENRLDFTSRGVELGHDSSSGVSITGFVGRSEIDDDLASADFGGLDLSDLGLKADDVGLRFSGPLGQRASVFGSALRTRYSADGTTNTVQVSTLGLGASFEAAEGLDLFAAAERTKSDDVGLEVTTVSVGASYALDLSGRPVYLSGEMSQTRWRMEDEFSVTKDNVKRFNFGVTVPLGQVPSQALPGGTVAKSVADGSRTGMSSVFGLARF